LAKILLRNSISSSEIIVETLLFFSHASTVSLERSSIRGWSRAFHVEYTLYK